MINDIIKMYCNYKSNIAKVQMRTSSHNEISFVNTKQSSHQTNNVCLSQHYHQNQKDYTHKGKPKMNYIKPHNHQDSNHNTTNLYHNNMKFLTSPFLFVLFVCFILYYYFIHPSFLSSQMNVDIIKNTLSNDINNSTSFKISTIHSIEPITNTPHLNLNILTQTTTLNLKDIFENSKYAILAIFSFLFIVGGLMFPTPGPFSTPLPLLWRSVFTIGLIYEVFLIFLLFQNKNDVRYIMSLFDPTAGSPLDERDYAVNCALTYDNVMGIIFDRFALSHFLGWMLKYLILRDIKLCWIISIMWEFLEILFTPYLPNFAECWWDQWGADVLICNNGGIICGWLLLKYCYPNSIKYNWIDKLSDSTSHQQQSTSPTTHAGCQLNETDGFETQGPMKGEDSQLYNEQNEILKDENNQNIHLVPTLLNDDNSHSQDDVTTPRNTINQLTSHAYSDDMNTTITPQTNTSTLIFRFIIVQGIITLAQLEELNAFYLKHILWIPPESYLNPLRLIFWTLFSFPCVREFYYYFRSSFNQHSSKSHSHSKQLPRPRERTMLTLGPMSCLCVVMIITELLIIIKFSTNEFTNVVYPATHVLLLVLCLTIYGIGCCLCLYKMFRDGKQQTQQNSSQQRFNFETNPSQSPQNSKNQVNAMLHQKQQKLAMFLIMLKKKVLKKINNSTFLEKSARLL